MGGRGSTLRGITYDCLVGPSDSASGMIETGLLTRSRIIIIMTPSTSSMPHLIFQIDEILRLIAKYIGQVSKSAAVEFACCCQAFEEPALRPLWEDTTLRNLMYVLSKDVLHFDGPATYVGGSPSLYFLPN